MAMSQERINSNLTNMASLLSKALLNVNIRQKIMFDRLGDPHQSDLVQLDITLLNDLVEQIRLMREQL